jgi:hypothetical protein
MIKGFFLQLSIFFLLVFSLVDASPLPSTLLSHLFSFFLFCGFSPYTHSSFTLTSCRDDMQENTLVEILQK